MKILIQALAALFVTFALFACGGVESDYSNEDQLLAEAEDELVRYGDWDPQNGCTIGQNITCYAAGSPNTSSTECAGCSGPYVGANSCFMDCNTGNIYGTVTTPRPRSR